MALIMHRGVLAVTVFEVVNYQIFLHRYYNKVPYFSIVDYFVNVQVYASNALLKEEIFIYFFSGESIILI